MATKEKFLLKPMVFVRMFAEMTVLTLLIALPFGLTFAGKLSQLPLGAQIVLWAAALLAASIVPWYGFITYFVTISDTGLLAKALFLRQSCDWSEMKALSRRSNYNWQRYAIELRKGKEITFPTVLQSCDDLVALIRAKLPAGSGHPVKSAERAFHSDPIALFFQFIEAGVGILFMVVCWAFFASIVKTSDRIDALVLVSFCLAGSAVLGWRSWMVALMPRRIQLDQAELVVRTLFFERRYSWADVLSVKPPSPLLPDGFMLKTKKGTYLIGGGMNASDELQEALKAKLQPKS